MNSNNTLNARKTDPEILKFLKNCYRNYLDGIREQVKEFPSKYVFPDGNPVLPVLPARVVKSSIMIIGAFPSARFERRDGYLIPVANNLAPFADEIYFDGNEIRKQASREALNNSYFPQLGIDPGKIWLTDLVKVYLFPQKHIRNCEAINNKFKYVNTHKMFPKIAKASIRWIKREIGICNPELIITLGEIPARVIRNENKLNNKDLLNGSISKVDINGSEYSLASLAHPEIRRIIENWDKLTIKAIERLRGKIENILH